MIKLLSCAELALAKATRDSDAALLFHLLALGHFNMNDSTGAAERAFQTALSLDPFSLAIRHDHERVQSRNRGIRTSLPIRGNWERSPLPFEEVKRAVYQLVQPPPPALAA